MTGNTRAPLPVRLLVLPAMFAAVTSVLAYVRIPLPISPVPITGQTFGMMLAGLLAGPQVGALSQAVYLLLGITGFPVFAGGQAGLGVLFGPTGGYLWGHVLGAYVTGLVAGPSGHVPAGGPPVLGRTGSERIGFGRSLAGAVLGGIVVVYALGVVQLAAVTGMGLSGALMAGAVPFLPGDALKAVAAAAVAVRLAPVVSTTLVRPAPASHKEV